MHNILHNNPDGWVSLAIIENGIPKIDTRPINWLNNEGNPLNKEEIISLGYYGVKKQPYSVDYEKEKVIENPIEEAIINEENHELTITYNITPLSINELSSLVRTKRDKLLQDSDVLVFADRWENWEESKKTLIKEYRQNLRDIPDQENFPNDVIWPSFSEIYDQTGVGNPSI